MHATRTIFLSCAVILATLISLPAISQSQESAPPEPIRLIKMNFPGGTAVDYVAAVRKAYGDLNVFLAPEAAQVPMPAVELTNVTASTALQLLHDRRVNVSGSSIQLLYDEVASESGEAERVFNIQARVSGRNADFTARTQVWSVAGILASGMKSDDVLSAIETALQMISKDVPGAQIRFHQSTGLLIVRGSHEQLESIQQVLTMLEVAISERQYAENPASNADADLKKALHEREMMIQKLQVRIQALEAELASAKAKPQ